MDRHVALLGHITLPLSLPVIARTTWWCVVSIEATRTNFIIFGLVRLRSIVFEASMLTITPPTVGCSCCIYVTCIYIRLWCPNNFHIRRCWYRLKVTQLESLVGKELLTLPEHLSWTRIVVGSCCSIFCFPCSVCGLLFVLRFSVYQSVVLYHYYNILLYS